MTETVIFCLNGRRPWWCCSNGGYVTSTLGDSVTIDGCITSIGIGYNLGSDGEVGVVDSEFVAGGTSNLGSCTGGSGADGSNVKCCKASSNCSKELIVVSPS